MSQLYLELLNAISKPLAPPLVTYIYIYTCVIIYIYTCVIIYIYMYTHTRIDLQQPYRKIEQEGRHRFILSYPFASFLYYIYKCTGLHRYIIPLIFGVISHFTTAETTMGRSPGEEPDLDALGPEIQGSILSALLQAGDGGSRGPE